MYGVMRKISCLCVLMATLLLLAFRTLPHHHHTIYIPGVEKALTVVHFGTEHCEHVEEESHEANNDCSGTHLEYTECKSVELLKIVYSYDLSSALLPVDVEVVIEPLSAPYISFYKIPKIPDDAFDVVSLRAPPAV